MSSPHDRAEDTPSDYDYRCDFCGLWFDSGCGGEIDTAGLPGEPEVLRICTPCEVAASHITYMRGKVEDEFLNQIEIKQI